MDLNTRKSNILKKGQYRPQLCPLQDALAATRSGKVYIFLTGVGRKVNQK